MALLPRAKQKALSGNAKTYKGKKAPAGYHFMPNGKLMKDTAHKKSGGSVRNYKGEYSNYHSSTEQKKRRASRNTARRRLTAAGKVKKVTKRMWHTRMVTLKIIVKAILG